MTIGANSLSLALSVSRNNILKREVELLFSTGEWSMHKHRQSRSEVHCEHQIIEGVLENTPVAPSKVVHQTMRVYFLI